MSKTVEELEKQLKLQEKISDSLCDLACKSLDLCNALTEENEVLNEAMRRCAKNCTNPLRQ